MRTKKITLNELRSLVKQIIKEENESNYKYLDVAKVIFNNIKDIFRDVEIVFRGKNKNLARVTFSIDNIDYITTFFCGESSDGRLFCQYYNSDDEGDFSTNYFNSVNELIDYLKDINK